MEVFFYGYLVTIRDPKVLMHESFGLYTSLDDSSAIKIETDFDGKLGGNIVQMYFYEATSVKILGDNSGYISVSPSAGSFVELRDGDSPESRFIKVLVLFNIPLLQV
eukprot:GHVS01000844.1.p1 GENE.GHVS01000844.1~~GHVS01000844.1.p1  ORF type:complete len:107 (-),score=7.04 GHVS01000844.1:639-959(-)